MEIKRELETTNAVYDIKGLNHEQFVRLFRCYEKQMHIYYESKPDGDELYTKLKKMIDSSVTIIK